MTEAQIELKRERKRLHAIQSKYGWESEEGRKASRAESELYTKFLENNSAKELLEATLGKSNGTTKQHNSKGDGYGDL
jgi:hypothetical protein